MQALYNYYWRVKRTLSGQDKEAGYGVAEWALILAGVVGLAILVVGVVTSLVNNELDKLPQ